jgi:hypothetical protein
MKFRTYRNAFPDHEEPDPPTTAKPPSGPARAFELSWILAPPKAGKYPRPREKPGRARWRHSMIAGSSGRIRTRSARDHERVPKSGIAMIYHWLWQIRLSGGRELTLSGGGVLLGANRPARRNRVAVRQQLTRVVEQDDAVAEQAPPLLGVTGDGASRVPVMAVSGRTRGLVRAHGLPRSVRRGHERPRRRPYRGPHRRPYRGPRRA